MSTDLLAQGLKRCPRCETVKPLDAFHVDRSRKDGRMSRCGDCDNANGRATYTPTGRPRGYNGGPRKDPAECKRGGCTAAKVNTKHCETHAREDREASKVRKAKLTTRRRADALEPYADPSPKHCTRCFGDLPRSAFRRRVDLPDGLHSHCRDCERQTRQPTRSPARPCAEDGCSQTRNAPSDPLCAMHRAVVKARRQADRLIKQAGRQAVRVAKRHTTEKWCVRCDETLPREAFNANPTKPDGLQRRCKPCASAYALARHYGGRERLWLRDRGVCYLCGCDVPLDGNWHAEHIHPAKHGGTDDPSNLAVACAPCNLAKRDAVWPYAVPSTGDPFHVITSTPPAPGVKVL